MARFLSIHSVNRGVDPPTTQLARSTRNTKHTRCTRTLATTTSSRKRDYKFIILSTTAVHSPFNCKSVVVIDTGY
jgi:hypothetical protein